MKTRLPRRWYVVADAGRAIAYAHLVPGGDFKQVSNWASELSLPSDQQPKAQGKPGRVFESVGEHRHAAETVTPRELLKHAFGRTLARALNKARRDGAFEGLVLYAAPRFLHELRQHLDNATAKATVHSEPKDLTRLPEQELFEVFESVPKLAADLPRPGTRAVGDR